jgi:hypothetical protein
MIGVVDGPGCPDHPLPERRDPIAHALASGWQGPACNGDMPLETGLRTGALAEVDRITCWSCRHLEGEPCTDPACRPCHPSEGLTRD